MTFFHLFRRAAPMAALLIALSGCAGDDSDQTDAGTTEVCETPCGKECCNQGKACDTKNMRCTSVCQPNCTNRQCGSDGCGGSCGSCPSGLGCVAGECTDCTPNCLGKQCGDDGCGGKCGFCPNGNQCGSDGLCGACQRNCQGKTCGPDGCGGNCGHCQPPFECGGGGIPGQCGRR